LDPAQRSGKTIEGASTDPAEQAGKERMEKKVEEVAAKKSKARSREGEVKGQSKIIFPLTPWTSGSRL
jgi:hypothetical protein